MFNFKVLLIQKRKVNFTEQTKFKFINFSIDIKMSIESALLRSQQLLEQNEDTIAACVENLQLGRLDECIKHYIILKNNLISMAIELDKYPTGEDIDPFQELLSFPDEIMRKVCF